MSEVHDYDHSLLDDGLLDERSVASLLHVQVATLRRWRWAGVGPRFIKIGAAVRYARGDLEDYVRSRRRQSTSDGGAC